MNDPYSNLSADEKRIHKQYAIAEYCASFADGCTETQLVKFSKQWGNISSTILRLLADAGESGNGFITRIGPKYYVTNTNYIAWGEAKGIRDKIFYTKCQECGAIYESTLEKCLGCGKKNKILNELGGYTHTSLIPQPDNIEELTTESNTHIHTKTSNEESLPRSERVKEGRNADKRVVKILEIFGSAKLGAGRGGQPDVFFNSKVRQYCVEVKSVENQVRSKSESVNGYKVGTVPLSRKQWIALCAFGEANDFEPLLIVEVKINGSQNLYHFIKRDQVDSKLGSTEAVNIRISVHDVPIMSIHNYREGVPLVGSFLL